MAKTLKELRADLETQKATIEKSVAPLYEEREKLAAEIAPKEAQIRELSRKIKKAEVDAGLSDISREIAGIARAQGARSIKAEA